MSRLHNGPGVIFSLELPDKSSQLSTQLLAQWLCDHYGHWLSLGEVICTSLKATYLLWDQEACPDTATWVHSCSSVSAEWVSLQVTASQVVLLSYLQRLIVMIKQRKTTKTIQGPKRRLCFSFFLPPLSLLESIRDKGETPAFYVSTRGRRQNHYWTEICQERAQRSA